MSKNDQILFWGSVILSVAIGWGLHAYDMEKRDVDARRR